MSRWPLVLFDIFQKFWLLSRNSPLGQIVWCSSSFSLKSDKNLSLEVLSPLPRSFHPNKCWRGGGGDQVRETASTDPPGPSSLHYIWYGLFIGSFKNLNKCLKILKIVKNLEQMSQITLFAKSYVISITKIFFRTTLSCNWSPWTSLRFDLLIGSPSLVLS